MIPQVIRQNSAVCGCMQGIAVQLCAYQWQISSFTGPKHLPLLVLRWRMRGIHSAVHRSFHGRNRRAAAAAGDNIWHRITQQFPQQIFLVGNRKFQAALFPGTSRRDRGEVRLVPAVQLFVVVGICWYFSAVGRYTIWRCPSTEVPQ